MANFRQKDIERFVVESYNPPVCTKKDYLLLIVLLTMFSMLPWTLLAATLVPLGISLALLAAYAAWLAKYFRKFKPRLSEVYTHNGITCSLAAIACMSAVIGFLTVQNWLYFFMPVIAAVPVTIAISILLIKRGVPNYGKRKRIEDMLVPMPGISFGLVVFYCLELVAQIPESALSALHIAMLALSYILYTLLTYVSCRYFFKVFLIRKYFPKLKFDTSEHMRHI